MKQRRLLTILNAMEKNGFPQCFGQYEDSDGKCCTIGQGAKNLGIDAYKLGNELANIRLEMSDKCNLQAQIIYLNDIKKLGVKKIARQMKKLVKNQLYKLIPTYQDSLIHAANDTLAK